MNFVRYIGTYSTIRQPEMPRCCLHRGDGNMDRDQVLRVYRRGDEDKRIALFLAYRDLREEFGDIKQDPDVVQYSENRGRT